MLWLVSIVLGLVPVCCANFSLLRLVSIVVISLWCCLFPLCCDLFPLCSSLFLLCCANFVVLWLASVVLISLCCELFPLCFGLFPLCCGLCQLCCGLFSCSNSVINYSPSRRSKPVRPSFIFGTQIKMFLMKSESYLILHRQQCHWNVPRSRNVVNISVKQAMWHQWLNFSFAMLREYFYCAKKTK